MEHESTIQQFGEEGLRLLVQNAPDLILVLDADGREIYASPSVQKVIGSYPVEERRGKNLFDFVHPEDAATAYSLMEDLLANPGGTSPKTELRVRLKDGSLRYFESTGTNLLDEPSVAGIVINARDVTEQKLAERERRDYEERLRTLADAAFEGILISEDGIILEVNQAMAEILGYEPEELVGRLGLDFVAPGHRETVARHISAGSEEPYEAVGIRKDGSPRDLEVRGRAFVYRDRPVRIAAIRDITERKRSEAALKESEERFRQLFERSADTLLLHDEEGRLLDCNEEACRSLGYSRKELLDLRVQDFAANLDSGDALHALDGKFWRRASATGIDRPLVGAHLAEHTRKDGTKFPVDVRVEPVSFRGERRMLASCRDLSDLKAAAEALRESEERFRTIFEQAPLGISIADPERKFLETNPAYQELTGYTAEELFGKPIAEISHPEDVPEDEEYNEEVAGGDLDRYRRGEKRYVRKDGEIVWVHPTISAVRDSGGEVRFLVGLVEDVTERRRMETRLREANQRLRELAVMKADFTAMVAHELSSPVAAVRNLLDVLETGESESGDRARLLSQLQNETDKLTTLVSDVRESAVVEREDFSVDLRRIPVENLIEDATAFARTLPGNHPLHVESSVVGEVWADPKRITQVLRNLISNAAKYSPAGAPIDLRTYYKADRACLEVADRGIGIHPDDVQRVFEKFGRGRDAAGRRMPGVGLGLYISRRIVRAHDGELSLDSTPGEGSVFGFDLETAGEPSGE